MKNFIINNPGKISLAVIFALSLMYIAACMNPFAPGKADMEFQTSVLGDQKTVEGVFKNFKYAYIFKDTVAYGKLLADDFNFIYTNYDRGVDVTWSREEDMITTYRLFNAVQNMDLSWNDVVVSTGDSVSQVVSRGFDLTIYFSSTDVINVQGRAEFHLERADTTNPWKITQWKDLSNY